MKTDHKIFITNHIFKSFNRPLATMQGKRTHFCTEKLNKQTTKIAKFTKIYSALVRHKKLIQNNDLLVNQFRKAERKSSDVKRTHLFMSLVFTYFFFFFLVTLLLTVCVSLSNFVCQLVIWNAFQEKCLILLCKYAYHSQFFSWLFFNIFRLQISFKKLPVKHQLSTMIKWFITPVHFVQKRLKWKRYLKKNVFEHIWIFWN